MTKYWSEFLTKNLRPTTDSLQQSKQKIAGPPFFKIPPSLPSNCPDYPTYPFLGLLTSLPKREIREGSRAPCMTNGQWHNTISFSFFKMVGWPGAGRASEWKRWMQRLEEDSFTKNGSRNSIRNW